MFMFTVLDSNIILLPANKLMSIYLLSCNHIWSGQTKDMYEGIQSYFSNIGILYGVMYVWCYGNIRYNMTLFAASHNS